MPKLTETTNDQLSKRRGRPPKPQATLGDGIQQFVTPPHEPLIGESFQLPQPADLTYISQPVTITHVQATPVPPGIDPLKEKQGFKVALIGTAPSSRMLAPYGDPTWKIWACSPGNMNALPRVDAWFEIHGSLLWPENKHYGEPYINWLRTLTIPVYMQDHRYIPNATPLPKEELVKEFGPYFFTSSFAWMMAMAMHEGATEIALYGIDMASRDEYILQRPGAYHFFNEARKRGVKISAPHESDIMQPPGLYGFSEVTPFGRKLLARTQELRERINGLRTQRDQAAQNITYLEGALEDLDYVTSIWGGVQNNSSLELDKP